MEDNESLGNHELVLLDLVMRRAFQYSPNNEGLPNVREISSMYEQGCKGICLANSHAINTMAKDVDCRRKLKGRFGCSIQSKGKMVPV